MDNLIYGILIHKEEMNPMWVTHEGKMEMAKSIPWMEYTDDLGMSCIPGPTLCWVMEYPDEWLSYDKVPKGLRISFETRNATWRKGQKEQNTLSVKISVEANAVAQENEVEVFIFL